MEDLEARKVYQILLGREAAREGYIRVVDESRRESLSGSALARRGEQGPARGVPPLLRVDLTHTRSVRPRPETAQGFDSFNGSSQLAIVSEGGALCRLRSTDVFRLALRSSSACA
jgi:hypothetical protein